MWCYEIGEVFGEVLGGEVDFELFCVGGVGGVGYFVVFVGGE